MRTRARAASIAMAGAALLVVPVVTAGPASAAPTVMAAPTTLTQATCEAGGGTFTLVKGLKKCTTDQPVTYMEDVPGTSSLQTDTADYTATYTVHLEQEYTLRTVQTQKGKGSIQTSIAFLSDTVVDKSYVVADGRTCTENGAATDISVCEGLGLYDF